MNCIPILHPENFMLFTNAVYLGVSLELHIPFDFISNQ